MVAKQKKLNDNLSISILEFVIYLRLGHTQCAYRGLTRRIVNLIVCTSCHRILIRLHSLVQRFWRYMVKPHEQLVLVSSTRYRAYTPNLSTS